MAASVSSSNNRKAYAAGFTLLEVLIAFAILAVALAALMQAFSHGINATRVAEERATAVMLARSVMDEVGRSIPLQEGQHTGDRESGLSWRLDIHPFESSEIALDEDASLQLYAVNLSVLREETVLAKIHSLRAGAKP
jgi:general secretion pathway protein I